MTESTKLRADEWLVHLGLVESRSKASALIMAGSVLMKRREDLPWEPVPKPGIRLAEGVGFQINDPTQKDVGRGATKLRGALDVWKTLSIQGAHALDIGSSTGGFTQVLLERGASSVLAMDVGTHQLHEKLRSDERVFSWEKTHVLHLNPEDWQKSPLKPPFDVIVTDVSFMSSTKLPSVVADWLKPQASWILLVKPQFEVGPKKAPKGIVKEESYRQEAIEGVRLSVAKVPNLVWNQIIESPISGGDGNKEYFAWIQKN
jgi:23S rRNA (cytidine1920-2'-O)/16S rRNA (cytidine1409-2'-O)-methyltransferase